MDSFVFLVALSCHACTLTLGGALLPCLCQLTLPPGGRRGDTLVVRSNLCVCVFVCVCVCASLTVTVVCVCVCVCEWVPSRTKCVCVCVSGSHPGPSVCVCVCVS